MRSVIAALALFLVVLATPAPARSGLVDAINAARAQGCAGRRGTSTPLRQVRKLDNVARRISKGDQLRSALSRAEYRAQQSSSMFMSGVKGDADIARTLAQRACNSLRDNAVREIGIERRGDDVWVVLAAPFATDELKDAAKVSERILDLANEARSRARRCGSRSMPAVPPLVLEKRLTEAARIHSRDMAKHSLFEHEGSDDSTVNVRVARTGYKWRIVGENIAAGATTPDEVMEGWLDSPGHCENIMSLRFTQMGVAWVVDPKSDSVIYWTQVFGAPR